MSNYRKNKVDKWDIQWYQELSCEARSVFDWLYTQCDWGGFYRINLREMVFKINLTLPKIEKALNECSKDLIWNNGWIWITDFLIHQSLYPQILTSKNNFHKSIIKLINNQLSRFPQTQLILDKKLDKIKSPDNQIISLGESEKKPPKPPKAKETYMKFDFMGIDGEPISIIKLTEKNWDNLIEKTTKKFAELCVIKLDGWYKGKSKRQYGDDNLKIYSWVTKAVQEDLDKNKNKKLQLRN